MHFRKQELPIEAQKLWMYVVMGKMTMTSGNAIEKKVQFSFLEKNV